MDENEYIKKEEELLKLTEHFKDNEDHYERIIGNLIALYTDWNRIDKLKSLRKKDIKKDLQDSINSTIRLLEIEAIKVEVEKSKKEIDKKTRLIEDKIEKERIKSVEILGIFGAIIAFLFSTVQIGVIAIRIDLELGDALFLTSGVALVLLGFIVALHLIIIEKRKKLLFYLFFFLVIVVAISQVFIYFQFF